MVCVHLHSLSDSLQGLKILQMWPIQYDKIPCHWRAIIETLLVCLNEIGIPEDLVNALIKCLGLAFKKFSYYIDNEELKFSSFW